MSQASLIKSLPENLSQPLGLATIASVGIHGLLWVILPVLPTDTKSEAHSSRTVGLVQLSPEEQSRIPQAVTPQQATLPPSALQQQGELPPLPPPLPYQPNILPPLPPPPSFNLAPIPGGAPSNNYPSQNSLPQSKTFVVPPPPPTQYNQSFATRSPFDPLPTPPAVIPNSQLAELPKPPTPNQAYRIPQSSPRRTFTPPANRSLPNLALQPSAPFVPDSLASQTTQYRISQPQNQQQNQQAAANRQTKPATSGSSNKLPERGKQELLALQQQIRERNNRNQESQSRDRSNRTAVSSAEQQQQQLLARLQSQQQPQGDTSNSTSPQTAQTTKQQQQLLARLQSQQQPQGDTSNSTSPQTAQTTEQQQLLARLQSQQQLQGDTSNSTSPQTARIIAQVDEFKERYQAVQQANPKVETKAPIREKVKTCEKQLDGRAAVFGVVFNPDGKIISGPDFIPQNSTIEIKQAAKNYLSDYQPQKSASPVDQSFRLDFQYSGSSCAKEANKQ